LDTLFSLAVTMGIIRMVSGLLEFCCGGLMIYFNRIDTSIKINAVLALIGPTVLVVTMSLGLIGIAGKVSLEKMLVILCGVVLIFFGLNKL
jgi:hypothetical protein